MLCKNSTDTHIKVTGEHIQLMFVQSPSLQSSLFLMDIYNWTDTFIAYRYLHKHFEGHVIYTPLIPPHVYA